MVMKKIVSFIFLLISLLNLYAQESPVRILTEKELPSVKRMDYIQQAKDFLTRYYRQLRFCVDNLITQESLKKNYLMKDNESYIPEFGWTMGDIQETVGPDIYIQELSKDYLELSRKSELEFRVSDIQADTDFYAPDITSLYVVLGYTLELYSDGKQMFKRRCQASCLFPTAMDFVNVRLLRVEPLQDLVPYKKATLVNNNTSDDKGNLQWEDNFDYVSKRGFDGRRIVRLRDKYGVVTEEGDIIVPMIYDLIGYQTLIGDCCWDKKYPIVMKRDNKLGYIDIEGREIVKPAYDNVAPYLSGHVGVQLGDKYGAIDETGKLVVPVKYDEWIYFPYDSEWGKTRLGKFYGFVHKDGKKTIPFVLDYADDFVNGRAAVVSDGLVGFCGWNGNLSIPFRYESVWNRKGKKGKYLRLYQFCKDGTAIALINKKLGLIDTLGRELTPFKYKTIELVSKYTTCYKATTKSGMVYLDHYGNEYETQEQCLEGMRKIQRERDEKDYQTAVSHFLEQKYNVSFPIFKRLAERGYEATFPYLGLSYYWGWGTGKNKEESFKYFSKSAEKGLAVAQYELYVFYFNGEVVEKDDKKAMEWLRKAAEGGYDRAIYEYASYLENGDLITKNVNAAVEWYEKLSRKGHINAKVRLGSIYRNAKDYDKAYVLFTEASELGDMGATMILAKIHYYGDGKPTDYKKAYDLFLKSADTQPESRYFLGWMNEYGQGCDKDIRKAVEWYRKCPGLRDADERAKNLEKRIR